MGTNQNFTRLGESSQKCVGGGMGGGVEKNTRGGIS